MKIWNNELFRISDYADGYGWSDIMDYVKQDDIIINGVGEHFVCDYATKASRKNNSAGYGKAVYDEQGPDKNDYVSLHPLKKDGTLHRGRKGDAYIFSPHGIGWKKST
tara:strand:- start:73 stop:396 length:324 start_codon:yes stop_codon:yes gene_type:complete